MRRKRQKLEEIMGTETGSVEDGWIPAERRLHGRGIYFAAEACKAMQYCDSTAKNVC